MNTPRRRAVITPDKHFPYADDASINVVCRTIEMVEPDIYIDLGDIGEWENFSVWKYKRRKKPSLDLLIPDLTTDFIDVNNGMDIIDESLAKVGCEEKHFCQGNHELWIDFFLEEYPYVDYLFNLKKGLKFEERGYEFHPAGQMLQIGKLNFYHGHHYGGMYHTANHLRKLGANIMYGHWHDLQHMTATHVDGPKGAWSIGCLKEMNNESNKWLGNRKVNWANAFAIVDFWEDGNFTVNILQIIDGKASVWGHYINGNKRKYFKRK